MSLIRTDKKMKVFKPALLKRKPMMGRAFEIISTGEGQKKGEKRLLQGLRDQFMKNVLENDFGEDAPKTKL